MDNGNMLVIYICCILTCEILQLYNTIYYKSYIYT